MTLKKLCAGTAPSAGSLSGYLTHVVNCDSLSHVKLVDIETLVSLPSLGTALQRSKTPIHSPAVTRPYLPFNLIGKILME